MKKQSDALRNIVRCFNLRTRLHASAFHHVPTLCRVSKPIQVLLSGLLISITAISTAHAALTATTANTIQGTLPYLTFDGGTTQVTTTDGLLGITLSDGTTSTSYKKSDLAVLGNPGTSTNPLELPVAGQKLKDIKTLIPNGLMTVTLNALVTTHNYWRDADGDGGPTVSPATSSLSISAVDANNNTIGLNDTFSACSSPYKVTLTSTAGTLSTQYGDPNDTSFTGDSATYYIKPKIATPYACWAAPNLTRGTGSYVSATHPEWEVGKGFKVPSPLGAANTHFPRTGAHGLFFDLVLAGVSATDVVTNSESTSGTGIVTSTSGVSLKLTVAPNVTDKNVLRVELEGPRDATNGGAVNLPATFRLYGGAGNEVYNFELSKWFVARPGVVANYAAAQTYCGGLSGSYRVPSVSEYTNANGNGWTWGLSGQGNNYARAIGNGAQKNVVVAGIDDGDSLTTPVTSKGGLFAEWGFTAKNDARSPYISSDFELNGGGYWAVDPYSSTKQHLVGSTFGSVFGTYPSVNSDMAACVTP